MATYVVNKWWGPSSHYRFQHEVVTSRNDTARTTALTGKAWIVSDAGWDINATATKYGNFRMDGGDYAYSHVFGNWGGGAWRQIGGPFTKTVSHNDDGTRQIDIGGHFNPDVTINGTKYTTQSFTHTYFWIEAVPAIGGRAWVKVGSTWKHGTAWVKVAGTWRKSKAVFVNVAGTWRKSK
jgi:hypothetical protein